MLSPEFQKILVWTNRMVSSMVTRRIGGVQTCVVLGVYAKIWVTHLARRRHSSSPRSAKFDSDMIRRLAYE